MFEFIKTLLNSPAHQQFVPVTSAEPHPVTSEDNNSIDRENDHWWRPNTDGNIPIGLPVHSIFQGANPGADSPTFYTPNAIGNAGIQNNQDAIPDKTGNVGIKYPNLKGRPSGLNYNDTDARNQRWQTSDTATGHQRQPVMFGPVRGRDENFSSLRAQLIPTKAGHSGPVTGGNAGGTAEQAFLASQQQTLDQFLIKQAMVRAL
jgi:hypothetical protein